MKPGRVSIEGVAFALSIAFLAFLYGFFANQLNLFPKSLITRAMGQAEALFERETHHGFIPHHLFPIVYREAGARTLQPGRMQPGLTLLTSYWKDFDWRPGARLIDADGRVLHAWRIDPAEIWPDLPGVESLYVHGTYLFPDGDLLLNVEYASLVRVDACGKVKWALNPARYRTHHAVSRADDGTFWVPASAVRGDETEADRRYLARYPPLTAPLYDISILHVTPDGEVLREIPLLDVLYRNHLQRYIFKIAKRRTKDVFHLNDVEPLPAAMAARYPRFEAGDLVVSMRFLNLVMVLDPETLAVKWHAIDPFIEQHDPDFIGDGWIGVFDNNMDHTPRGGALGGSRIVAVRPDTGEVRLLYPTERSDPFYTPTGGKWQLLANGNMLITEARPGRVFEAAPDGTTVWSWVNAPYDAKVVSEVLEGTRYDLTPEQVAAWPCGPAGEGM